MVGGWVMPMGPLRVYNKHSEDILPPLLYQVRLDRAVFSPNLMIDGLLKLK